jgi:hypothetical protein
MENSCYRFEKYTFTDGIFSDTVDATYIIHLEGNGRLESVKKQIAEIHPTNTVYIVFNKGFKKCKKPLKVQNSMYDITYTNLEVFKHSKLNNYSNILVLEDDFIFNKDIRLTRHKTNINKFLMENSNKKFIYHLGALPFITIPYNLYTYTSLCLAAHASIFTAKAQTYILDYAINNDIDDWDMFLLKKIWRYVYYTPMCYQIFPETENKLNWKQMELLTYTTNKFISYTNFDKQPEPATSYIYIIANLVSFILLILILFIVYMVISYFKLVKVVSKLTKKVRLKL